MSITTTPQTGIMARLGNAGKPTAKTKARRMGEGRRITMLVEMDKRRREALGRGDKPALMVLASEYAGIRCPNTARQVMNEAMGLWSICSSCQEPAEYACIRCERPYCKKCSVPSEGGRVCSACARVIRDAGT